MKKLHKQPTTELTESDEANLKTMFFKYPTQEPHSKLSVTSQMGEDVSGEEEAAGLTGKQAEG
jgi:hypothetical protein